MGQGNNQPLPCSALLASLVLPHQDDWPCFAHLSKERQWGLTCRDHHYPKSLIQWTRPLPAWSLVPHPHSHQKGGLTRSPVTNSCPTLFQYISKNVPATDHVIRRETETTFSGSHSCSPSHHCSTATPTSSHRWAPPGSPDRRADSCTRTHRE